MSSFCGTELSKDFLLFEEYDQGQQLDGGDTKARESKAAQSIEIIYDPNMFEEQEADDVGRHACWPAQGGTAVIKDGRSR